MAALLYKLSNYTPPADLDPGDLVQPEKDPQPGGTADPGQAEGPGQTADPDQPEDPGQTSQPEEPAVPVEGITLDTGELTLQAGSSYHFTPTLSPEGAAGTVVWTSSVPTVAPVTSDGTITNLNTTGGQVSVTITASCGDACTSAVVLCDTAASAGTVRGAENGLNVRSGPSTSHSVVGYLREGGRVILRAPRVSSPLYFFLVHDTQQKNPPPGRGRGGRPSVLSYLSSLCPAPLPSSEEQRQH